ncbi:MAG: radical SAM protein, partial [Clostridiales bacterium]
PCLSGERGSGAIFFSGCTLRCVFCQNYQVSHGLVGKDVDSSRLAEIFRELTQAGAHNINLVTGDHYAAAIIEALAIYRPPIPLVWNSSGYVGTQTIAQLAKFIDIFLPDLKFSDAQIAAKYSGHRDYFQRAAAAVALMRRYSGPAQLDGMMLKGTLVRHLILPAAVENSCRIIDFMATLPPHTPVSIMAQYVPCGDLENFPELQRKITKKEHQQVLDYLFRTDLDGWVQERESADAAYIPLFDYSGV